MYRRLMLRIAERIARSTGSVALVTGDAVGQVASQTLENIAVINDVASLPVLRPLVGMDKEEIVQEARNLGTYPISIIPDEDCCTLFTPQHPATRDGVGQIEAAEVRLNVDELVEMAVNNAERTELRYPTRLS